MYGRFFDFFLIHTKSLARTPVSDCSLTRNTTTGRRVAHCTEAPPVHPLFLEASRPPDVAASLRGKRRGGAWPGNPLLPIPGAGAQHGGLRGERRARIQPTNRGILIPRVAEKAGI